MRKTKEQKAITLIALIITIIVLLILALVTIRAVQGDGIIGYAQKAKNDYERESANENTTLGGYLSIIESNLPGGNNIVSGGEGEATIAWTDNGNGTITSSNGVTVEIGDYVDYNEGNYTHTPDTQKGAGTSKTGGDYSTGYTLGTGELTTKDLNWRVLGVNEQGQLELISAVSANLLYLANDEGYVNAENNLNNLCNDLYGKGTFALSARSLNVEDVNKLTNYDPTTYSGYGVEWIYRYPTEEEMGSTTRYMQYSKDGGTTWNNETDSGYQTFRVPEEETAISSTNPGRKELTYTYYEYKIADNLTTADGYSSEKVKDILQMLTSSNCWLASNAVNCNIYASFYIRCIYSNGIYPFEVEGVSLCGSFDGFWSYYRAVRPVVSLVSEITLTGSGEDIGSESNMWSITQN